MTTIIRRTKSDKVDNNFTARPKPVEYKPITPQNLNNQGQQEMTYAQTREIRATRRESLAETRRQKMIALNFGFNSFGVFELYQDDMKTQHDVYRSISMSRFWSINSLWDTKEDKTNSEAFVSQKLRFKTNLLMRKVSFFELRDTLRQQRNELLKHYITPLFQGNNYFDWLQFERSYQGATKDVECQLKSMNWKDGYMLLSDANSIHEKPVMTPCKVFEIKGVINLVTGFGLVIKGYALKGQYYLSYYEKNYNQGAYSYNSRKVLQTELTKTKRQDVFEKCHLSKSNQTPISRPIKIELTRPLKDNYFDWQSFIVIGMKQSRRYKAVKPMIESKMFFDILRETRPNNYFDWLNTELASLKHVAKTRPKNSQGRKISKFVDVNLWKLAKSDELFLERFRLGNID